MFEMGTRDPFARSGLTFPKTASEISSALKARRSEAGRAIEERKARIFKMLDDEGVSVDEVIALATTMEPHVAVDTIPAHALRAYFEARDLLADRAILAIFALADDHFDADRCQEESSIPPEFDKTGDDRFEEELFDLTFQDIELLFKPFVSSESTGLAYRAPSISPQSRVSLKQLVSSNRE